MEKVLDPSSFDFWADRGVLGVIALVAGLAFYFGVREIWTVIKPHIADWLKNQADLPKKQGQFIEHVTETYDEQLEFNRRQVAAIEAQNATIQAVATRLDETKTAKAIAHIAHAGKAAFPNMDVQRHLDKAIESLE